MDEMDEMDEMQVQRAESEMGLGVHLNEITHRYDDMI
jgi:hypothetical protein